MISKTMVENEVQLRAKMAAMLSLCKPEQQDLFRRMYNHEGKFKRDVDGVSRDRLDNAFSQIEKTLENNSKL